MNKLCWMSQLLHYSGEIYLTSNEMSMLCMKWEHLLIFNFTLHHISGMYSLEKELRRSHVLYVLDSLL